MKKAIAVLLILAIPLMVAGQDFSLAPRKELKIAKTDHLFQALQITSVAMTWADFAITTCALASGMASEGNPLAAWYISSPPMAVAVCVGISVFVTWGLSEIHKDNKLLGYSILLASIALRGVVLSHNMRVMHAIGRLP